MGSSSHLSCCCARRHFFSKQGSCAQRVHVALKDDKAKHHLSSKRMRMRTCRLKAMIKQSIT